MPSKQRKFNARQFGLAVRRKRETLGLSQEELADRANLHRTYISSIELGKVNMSLEAACELAAALSTRLSNMVRQIEQLRPSAETSSGRLHSARKSGSRVKPSRASRG